MEHDDVRFEECLKAHADRLSLNIMSLNIMSTCEIQVQKVELLSSLS